MKKFLIATCMVFLMASSSFSFDGNRNGFVLGGGLGFAPTAEVSLDGSSPDASSSSGFGLNLLIGYAWDENNMIVYEGNVAGYTINSIDLAQGFNGASWYHYFGLPGKSLFTTVGLGFYVFEADGFDANDPGGAFLLGAGYEFSPHWQVGAYFSSGKTTDPIFDYKHNHFNILISGIIF